MKSIKGLVVFIVIVFAIASLGAIFKPGPWYAGLDKPFFNAPAWLFAPVWALLYVFIAVAGWRVYARVGLDRSVVLWGLQLGLNGIWSPIFFGWHQLTLALVDIALLLACVISVAALFLHRDRAAGWLMVPYALWVAFAALLTASIRYLNPA